MRQYTVENGTGKHKVILIATVTPKGILSILVGGEEPHLGAVVLSVPRQSLGDPKKISCTSSVLPLPGHKDDEAARPLAELLARETGFPVSVSAGLHINNAGLEDIEKLKENTLECGKQLLDQLGKEFI
ncbi:MAG: prenylated flavin chaperone LpdD [Desulfocucumaceae bacterium]